MKEQLTKRIAELQQQINQRALQLVSQDPIGASLIGAREELGRLLTEMKDPPPETKQE